MRSTLRIPWLCNFTRIGYETFIAPPFIHYITVEVPFAPLMLLAKIRIDLLSCHLQEYNQNIQRQYLLVSILHKLHCWHFTPITPYSTYPIQAI